MHECSIEREVMKNAGIKRIDSYRDLLNELNITIINDRETIKTQRELIERLKEQLPRWIPCSERLPEYGVSVLTYDGNCYCVEKRIPYICDDHGEHLISDWWVSDDYDEADSDYYPNLRDGACIAWMPLPTYEGVKE